ncbi:MAG: NUDIX hydrolase [Bacteroidota bacterium]
MRLILVSKGHILMLKQTSENGGKYTLIGGNVEEGEYPVEALVRETMEEAGIKIKKVNIQLVHTLFKRKTYDNRIVLYFKVKSFEGEPISREPKKFKKVAWFPLDELPRNMSVTVRHVLEQFRQGKAYSELEK